MVESESYKQGTQGKPLARVSDEGSSNLITIVIGRKSKGKKSTRDGRREFRRKKNVSNKFRGELKIEL